MILSAKQTYEQPDQHSGRATYQVLWALGLTQAILAPECRTESPINMTLLKCLWQTGRYHIWELHVFHAGERKIFGQGQQREGCVSPQAMHKHTLHPLGTNMKPPLSLVSPILLLFQLFLWKNVTVYHLSKMQGQVSLTLSILKGKTYLIPDHRFDHRDPYPEPATWT